MPRYIRHRSRVPDALPPLSVRRKFKNSTQWFDLGAYYAGAAPKTFYPNALYYFDGVGTNQPDGYDFWLSSSGPYLAYLVYFCKITFELVNTDTQPVNIGVFPYYSQPSATPTTYLYAGLPGFQHRMLKPNGNLTPVYITARVPCWAYSGYNSLSDYIGDRLSGFHGGAASNPTYTVKTDIWSETVSATPGAPTASKVWCRAHVTQYAVLYQRDLTDLLDT